MVSFAVAAVDLRCKSRHLHAVQNIGPVNDFLRSQMPAALEMLRQMVGINSFTGNRDGVNRLGRFTAECFAPMASPLSSFPRPTRSGAIIWC